MFKKFLILFPVAVLLLGGGVFGWVKVSGAPSTSAQKTRLVITRGMGASQIANKLYQAKLIKSALAFKFLVQLTGRATKIQAGEYELTGNLSLVELVQELLRGPREVWVTIPEGIRREEIAERFAEAFGNPDFYEDFVVRSKGKEGYLFPDTYLFPKTATASAVVTKMEATFGQRVDFEVTREEVILASILERETVTEEERPVVAGILAKRAKAGWPLQADATVQYALGERGNWWKRPLTREDLEIASPYNTYKYEGLPPGPIANPGLSSLRAAANPEELPYWFYLHDAKGVIHYAATIEEHNENVRRYLGK